MQTALHFYFAILNIQSAPPSVILRLLPKDLDPLYSEPHTLQSLFRCFLEILR